MKLRRKLYSEKRNKNNYKTAQLVGAAGLLVAAPNKLRNLQNLAAKGIMEEGLAESNSGNALGKRLAEDIKKDGIVLREISNPAHSSYSPKGGRVLSELHRDILKKDGMEFNGNKMTNPLIQGSSQSPSVLAHEYGHHKNHEFIGKRLSKASMVTRSRGVQVGSSVGGGFVSGFKNAKNESEGKKDRLSKHGGALSGLAISTPMLLDEGLASTKGYKILKNLGADKTQLKTAKGNLKKAFGTYGILAGTNMALGVGSQAAGKLAGKSYYKNKKNNETEM